MKRKHRHPLIKLPQRVELTLLLIREDLKSYKLFNVLHEVGFDDSPYRANLDNAVFAYAGFEEITDELCDFYCAALNKACEKLERDGEALMKETFNVYLELIDEEEGSQ